VWSLAMRSKWKPTEPPILTERDINALPKAANTKELADKVYVSERQPGKGQ
jgi:hypothetical protein